MPVLKIKNNGVWEQVGGIPDHTHVIDDITDFPTSLPANGGNADTVDGKHASDFASAAEMTTVQNDINDINTVLDGIEIPTTLPNPNPLTFTGAVEGSYDGSNPLSVNIPRGDSIVPAPSSADNGKYLGCEDGKAAWLPVEASGGGGTQEKIIDVTFDEEFNAAEISVDINGNPFLLSEFTLWFKVALVATGSYNYFLLSVNEGSSLKNLPGMNANLGTSFYVYGCYAKVNRDGSVRAIFGSQNNTDRSDARFAPIVGLSSVTDDTKAVNYGNGVYKFNISGINNTLAKGTRLIVYGVRK